MEIIRIPRIMRETSEKLRLKGKSIGFIPTMGSLHEGHLSLVRRAKEENDITVVSIFVNPLQFGEKEDFHKYPRDIESDREKLQKYDVDILFIPEAESMYSKGFSTYVEVKNLSDKLCGYFRPGHFRGVATVVLKLFNIVLPTRAYFGQKDFQQTIIIKRMVEDLNIDVDLIVCPTVREQDGLAMSSRNVYLNDEERKAATIIFKTLLTASQSIKLGASNPSEIYNLMQEMLSSEPLISEIQYAGVYDVESLDELKVFKKQNLLAIAVKIGDTRLIDNMIVDLN